MATLMLLNVWFIIWPNQKIVINSAVQVAEGGEADPAAAGAAPKAALASRTNTLFSAPMLFLMGSSAHLPTGLLSDASVISMIVAFGIVLALEANAVVGKQGPLTSVSGVISSSVALTVVLYLVMALL